MCLPGWESHLNIKTHFALLFQLDLELRMADALNYLKLPLEGTHYRGEDDAWNIAAIFLELMKNNN